MKENNVSNEIIGRTLSFTVPSGNIYTIREQNGEDDDILSNPVEAKNLTNLTNFIAGIVIDSTKGRITREEAFNMPCLDKYCILFQSRIHSLGKEIDFEWDWGKEGAGKLSYVEDLTDYLFDYSLEPTMEELYKKPNAIPYYPNKGQFEFTSGLASGKEIRFHLLTGKGEALVINAPAEQRTKNLELIARDLELKVDSKWEKVENFRIFSVKDMMEIRKLVSSVDPIFTGNSEIKDPVTGNTAIFNIASLPNFFFPGEM